MPSASVLEKKKQAVVSLKEKLEKSVAGVIVDYRGLTVEQDTALRSSLREAGVEYMVVKNSLLNFAAKDVGLEELEPALHGPTAIALHESDVVAPAKVLSNFAKNNEALEIKAGFIEGKVSELDEIKALANIPSKDTLLTMLACGLNANIANLARAINAIKEKKGS